MVYFTKTEYYIDESYTTLYLELFAWLIGTFIVIILGLGFLYTLVCWLYFVINLKNISPEVKVGLDGNIKGQAGQVPVELALSKALLPLIGYIKMRIIFEDGDLSDTILVNKFAEGLESLLPKRGAAILRLPDRKQYHIKGFLISFEDYLQFFRLSAFKSAKQSFYLHSGEIDVPFEEIQPSKTEEELQKIKTSRKVEGDYLSYKDFETGDDVRRIVWKIFAKNKELVVRIPEIINPYASHVEFYSSFYNKTLKNSTSEYATSMLNYYKDVVFNVCLKIAKSDKKVQFHIDQEINDFMSVDKKDLVGFQLSSASWQNDQSTNELKVSSSNAVICVSSLIDSDELDELINKSSSNLIVVKVSRHLDQQNLINIKNLFLRKEQKNELSKLIWMFSATRRKVKRNEKKMQELVSNQNFLGQVI